MKEILIYILSILFIPQYEDMYIVERNFVPEYIYMISEDNYLISSYSKSFIFNTNTRSKNNIPQCENCIIGYKRGYWECRYENRLIESEDEYATKIDIGDMQKDVSKSIYIKPMVKPISCNDGYILLKSSYPFLEENIYSYDIQNNILKEVEDTDYGIENIYVNEYMDLVYRELVGYGFKGIVNYRGGILPIISKRELISFFHYLFNKVILISIYLKNCFSNFFRV